MFSIFPPMPKYTPQLLILVIALAMLTGCYEVFNAVSRTVSSHGGRPSAEYIVIANTDLIVRDSPSLAGKEIFKLAPGKALIIFEPKETKEADGYLWVKVDYYDNVRFWQTGWITESPGKNIALSNRTHEGKYIAVKDEISYGPNLDDSLNSEYYKINKCDIIDITDSYNNYFFIDGKTERGWVNSKFFKKYSEDTRLELKCKVKELEAGAGLAYFLKKWRKSGEEKTADFAGSINKFMDVNNIQLEQNEFDAIYSFISDNGIEFVDSLNNDGTYWWNSLQMFKDRGRSFGDTAKYDCEYGKNLGKVTYKDCFVSEWIDKSISGETRFARDQVKKRLGEIYMFIKGSYNVEHLTFKELHEFLFGKYDAAKYQTKSYSPHLGDTYDSEELNFILGIYNIPQLPD